MRFPFFYHLCRWWSFPPLFPPGTPETPRFRPGGAYPLPRWWKSRHAPGAFAWSSIYAPPVVDLSKREEVFQRQMKESRLHPTEPSAPYPPPGGAPHAVPPKETSVVWHQTGFWFHSSVCA